MTDEVDSDRAASLLGEQPLRSPPSRATVTERSNVSFASPVYDSVESAAKKLGISVDALRARCRRYSRRVGDSIVADLGGGIVAFKFGRSWRILFPQRP